MCVDFPIYIHIYCIIYSHIHDWLPYFWCPSAIASTTKQLQHQLKPIWVASSSRCHVGQGEDHRSQVPPLGRTVPPSASCALEVTMFWPCSVLWLHVPGSKTWSKGQRNIVWARGKVSKFVAQFGVSSTRSKTSARFLQLQDVLKHLHPLKSVKPIPLGWGVNLPTYQPSSPNDQHWEHVSS